MESPSILTFQSIHLNYVRNSRAIAVLWCVFTVCFCIINIVIFMEPWLGATMDTEKGNYLKKIIYNKQKNYYYQLKMVILDYIKLVLLKQLTIKS
jgi:hypothetical protein